jgi:hypothetical protein
MRARLVDPLLPWWARLLPYSLPLLVILAAWGLSSFAVLALAIAAALAIVPPRASAGPAELELGPGFIRVRRGWRSLRIRARDVTGASTARIGARISVALSLRSRSDVPVLLELDREQDAERVRESLGIGHHGFGALGFPLATSATSTFAMVARVGTVAALLAIAFTPSGPASGALDVLYGVIAIACAMVWLGCSTDARSSWLLLKPDGAVPKTAAGYGWLPYASIADVRDTGDAIEIVLAEPHPPLRLRAPTARLSRRCLDGDQRAHLVAQLLAASARARGAGPMKREVAQRLAHLRRGAEGARAWLERLELAARLLRGESGYRAAPLDREDLWAALEDPEADADLRAAAARILVGVDPTSRVRIDATLAAVRDDATARRIRVAMRPLDEACKELENVEPDVVSPTPTPGASAPGPDSRPAPPR